MGSFPNLIYGDYGDERVISTAKIGNLPLGTNMELPDGKKYVHTRNGNAAMIPGNLYEGPVSTIATAGTAFSNGALAVNSAAVGATSIVITTTAGTALSKNVYAEGYITIASSVGTGIGYSYKVKSHKATASTAAATVTMELYDNETVQVALQAATTLAGLNKSLYDSVLITTADTVNVNAPAGVSCSSAAASSYVWLQTSGPAPLLMDATLLIGAAVVASTAAAGAGAPFIAPMASTAATNTSTDGWFIIGNAMQVSASLGYGLVDLCMK